MMIEAGALQALHSWSFHAQQLLLLANLASRWAFPSYNTDPSFVVYLWKPPQRAIGRSTTDPSCAMASSRQASLRRLETERQHQHHVGELKSSVRAHYQQKERGDWEAQSEARTALAAAARAEAERAQQAAEVEARRQEQMREAQRHEEEEREAAAEAARVTPAQRRAAMAQQARALAARREAERQALADEKLAQQFEGSCDLLRTLQSQRARQAAAQQWQQQVGERDAARREEQEAELRHQRDFEQYMQRWEERYQQVSEQALPNCRLKNVVKWGCQRLRMRDSGVPAAPGVMFTRP